MKRSALFGELDILLLGFDLGAVNSSKELVGVGHVCARIVVVALAGNLCNEFLLLRKTLLNSILNSLPWLRGLRLVIIDDGFERALFLTPLKFVVDRRLVLLKVDRRLLIKILVLLPIRSSLGDIGLWLESQLL
jgi:hypothetical protein